MAAANRPRVAQRHDRAGIRDPCAARAAEEAASAPSAANRPAVGQRGDRAGVGDTRAAWTIRAVNLIGKAADAADDRAAVGERGDCRSFCVP